MLLQNLGFFFETGDACVSDWRSKYKSNYEDKTFAKPSYILVEEAEDICFMYDIFRYGPQVSHAREKRIRAG